MEARVMEWNVGSISTTSESAGGSPAGMPGILDVMVDQVLAYEDEYGIIEPLNPDEATTGGYALSGLLEQRIAAIKGILVATGQGARLVRLDSDPEAPMSPQNLLLRGIVLQPGPH
jgi:hypothetical protein